ncbi:MAG: flagellar hook-length control protein FliK [Lachnospiraceae bacterium]|nr:flagellar hook-length control protein FliK [Lachnospiraceae bacterium]
MDINPLRNINIKREAMKAEESNPKKLAEQIKGNASSKASDAVLAEESLKASLTELLSGLNISGTEENMALILSLVKNRLPVSKENMQKLNQLVKLFKEGGEEGKTAGSPDASLDKALFMLKNHMPISSYGKLERLLKGESGLIKSFTDILNIIENMEESPLKHALKAAFLEADVEAPSPKTMLQEGTIPLPDRDMPLNINGIPKTSPQEPNKTQGLPSAPFNQEEAPLTENENINLPVPEDIHMEAEKAPEDKSLFKENIKQDKALASAEKNIEGKIIIDEKEEMPFPVKKEGEPEKILSKEEAIKKVLLKFENPEEINELLNDLRTKASKAEEIIEKSGGQRDEAGRIINNFKENIEFLNEIKTCVYVPIPIHTSKGPMEGELYVFGEKSAKKKGGAISALIALNTLNIGRIEAYIQKSEKRLNIQFRMNNMEAMTLLRKNTGILGNLLKEKGYEITALDVMEMEKAFNLISDEPGEKFGEAPQAFKDIKFDVKA